MGIISWDMLKYISINDNDNKKNQIRKKKPHLQGPKNISKISKIIRVKNKDVGQV